MADIEVSVCYCNVPLYRVPIYIIMIPFPFSSLLLHNKPLGVLTHLKLLLYLHLILCCLTNSVYFYSLREFMNLYAYSRLNLEKSTLKTS